MTLYAQCTACAHSHGRGKECRLYRTLAARDARPAQGRLLGLLVAWLWRSSDFADHGAHLRAARSPLAFGHAGRSAARDFLLGQPARFQELLDYERGLRPGEGLEPDGLP